MPIRTVYGNCPTGEYPAIFVDAFPARYPKGERLLVSFLILDEARQAPRQNNQGDDLYAVAVCNMSDGTNPKSKPYTIRRAMLDGDEYDPIDAAREVPDWAHFKARRQDGSRSIIDVRVDREKGVSLATHIKRPRDGVWQSILGEYEGHKGAERAAQPPQAGAPKFAWLQENGTAERLGPHNEAQLQRLPMVERHMWAWWSQTKHQDLQRWKDAEGKLVELTADQFAALGDTDKIRYRIALQRAGPNPFRYDG
jgi:hypothetical protein